MFNKKLIQFLAIIALGSCCSKINAEIRVVCSSALLADGYELRKNEYIRGIQIISQYGYPNPYVIEAIAKKGPTFLDQCTCNVFYSSANDARLRNKGVNEARTMLEGLKALNFHPDDMIIKLSGRYHLTSDYFLRLIENNPTVDAFAKPVGDCILTLCYAVRAKYLLEILENLDYAKMEREMICVELEVGKYIQKLAREKNMRVMYVNTLHVTGLVWGVPGYQPGTQSW